MEFKDIIKKLRIDRHLTMQELGDMIGVGKGTIAKWEDGTIKTARSDNVYQLAIALDVSPEYLMGISDDSSSYSEKLRQIEEKMSSKKIHIEKEMEIASPKLRKYVQDSNSMYEIEEKAQKLVDMVQENGIKEIRGTVTTKPVINTEPEETLLLALYRLLNKDNKQSLSNIIQNMIAKQSGEEGSTT